MLTTVWRSGLKVGGRGALVGVLWLGSALPAQAQIYSWYDDQGTLVLSDKPQPGTAPDIRLTTPARTPRVRAAVAVQATVSAPFDALIAEHARQQNLRPELVRAVVQVESAFNPRAVSPKGAQGLMQLMPGTARDLGVTNAFDPEQNVRAGVVYLRQLLDRYDGNEQLALAAYNAGPGAVDRYGESVPPYRETVNYVSKVSGLAGASSLARAASRIQKTTDVTTDGREIPLYTNVRK